jgi:hypothetical protein
MKRYRVLAIDFDTRATVLTQEIKTEWEPGSGVASGPSALL